MKKAFLSILLLSSALLTYGCKEEDFNPKGDFKDKYVLNCILRSDTTVQVATLSGDYNVSGYDGTENKNDPAIKGADIRVLIGDSVYFFKEKETPREDTSRYDSPVHYYYAENLRIQPYKTAEISAVLPNGRKLHASTFIPRAITANYSITDSLIPIEGRSYARAGWDNWAGDNTYFLPRFSLIYIKIVDGLPIRYTKNLPVRYVSSGGKDVPVYTIPSVNTAATFELDALNRTLNEISEGDPNKKNYVILTVLVDISTLDMNLSGYYSASRMSDDGLSVKVDQTDYTNIEGGLGIFGSFVKTRFSMMLDKNYIKSFGYKTKLGEE